MLSDFLSAAARRWQAVLRGDVPCHGLRVVMGNEACDADSIVSSVVYSFLASADPGAPSHVPILPIVRSKFRLRCETACLFDTFGVDTSSLLFWDDALLLSVSDAAPRDDLGVVLVDHNVLAPRLASLGDRVVGIVDHHRDEGAYEGVSGDARQVWFDNAAGSGVGSTCTVVSTVLGGSREGALPRDVAGILLGVILIDTVNMSPAAGKATAKDVAAVETLHRACIDVDASALYDRLVAEKFNPALWASLGIEDMLDYDYKSFSATTTTGGRDISIGSSSVLVPCGTLVERFGPDLCRGCVAVCEARSVDLMLLLTMCMSTPADGGAPVPSRELVMVAHDSLPPDVWAAVRRAVEGSLLLSVRRPGPLASLGDVDGLRVVSYYQRNAKASRKQVVPVMCTAVRGC